MAEASIPGLVVRRGLNILAVLALALSRPTHVGASLVRSGPPPPPPHCSGEPCDHCKGCEAVEEGGSCSAQCMAGYDDSGTHTYTCSSLPNSWTGGPLTCSPVQCAGLVPPGAVHACACDAGVYGQQCVAKCEPGYERESGDDHYMCDLHGHWSGGSLRCKGSTCTGLPTIPSHASVSPASRVYPSTVTVTCNDKHTYLAGEAHWVCKASDLHYYGGNGGASGVSSHLVCNPCKAIPDCDQVSCRKAHMWSKTATSTCQHCVAGWKPSNDQKTCAPRQCAPLQVENSKSITFTVNGKEQEPPVSFSGTAARPQTLAVIECESGYILTNSASDFVAKDESHNAWACGANTDVTEWKAWKGNAFVNDISGLPKCEPTCDAGPCSNAKTKSVGSKDHFSECFDNHKTQKFRCTCKMGWQGERCDVDVNECTDPGYSEPACEDHSAQCAVTQNHLPKGCSRAGFALQSPLQCNTPYWVDPTTKLPSGCDRDGASPLTKCSNTKGSWICGACIDDPSCCQDLTPKIPAVEIAPTEWHPKSQRYTVCDVQSAGKSAACPPNLQWQQSGCTGRAAAGRSTTGLNVNTSSTLSCEVTADLCKCHTNPKGNSEVYKLAGAHTCAIAGDVLQLSIDPEDEHSRKSAENKLTALNTFNITFELASLPPAWSRYQCQSSMVEDSMQWKATAVSLHHGAGEYRGEFSCLAAGLYDLRVATRGSAIQPQETNPQQIRIVPSKALLDNTLAQLQDSDGWCLPGVNGDAPRCRTMPSRSCKVLVRVRDMYGNERRRDAADVGPALDEVKWSTESTSGRPCADCGLNASTHAVWAGDFDSGGYEVEFAFAAKIEHEFLVVMTLNGESWGQPVADMLPPTQALAPALSGTTTFRYALHTSLDPRKCTEYNCTNLYNSAGDFDHHNCSAAGCIFAAGQPALPNRIELMLDWDRALLGEINVTVHRDCSGPQSSTGAKVKPSFYWEEPHYCQENITDIILCGDSLLPCVNIPPNWNTSSVGVVVLQVNHPGLYVIDIETTSTLPASVGGSIDLHLPSRQVSIGPGPADVLTSTVHPPRILQNVATSGNRGLGRYQLDIGDKGVPGEAYNFSFSTRDSEGNARVGQDELVVEITRLSGLDLGPGNKGAQYQLDAGPFNLTYLTKGLFELVEQQQHLRRKWDEAGNRWVLQDVSPTVSMMQIPTYGDHETGVYSLNQSVSEFGMFIVNSWFCSRQTLSECLQRSYKLAQPYKFTVCPQNTDVADSDSSAPLRNASLHGTLPGAVLDLCQCRAGFTSPTGVGESCNACARGKFQPGIRKKDCFECEAGTYCGCSSTGASVDPNKCAESAWNPACTTCAPCNAGKFQDRRGQGSCVQCVEGFDCSGAAMTYPIATPGHWIHPRNPREHKECKPKFVSRESPGACKGSSLWDHETGAMKPFSRITAMEKRCTTEAPPENGYAPGQLCFEVIGATCNAGYTSGVDGIMCEHCCKRSSYDPSFGPHQSCDGDMWRQSGMGGTCNACGHRSNTVLAALVVFVGACLAPFLLRLVSLSKHLGALHGPVMSVVNFFQTAAVFKTLNLHWPPEWVKFISEVAEVFNFTLPHWLSSLDPQCSFELTYQEKWLMMMFSPAFVASTMFIYVIVMLCLRRLARSVLRGSQLAQQIREHKERLRERELTGLAGAGTAASEPTPDSEPGSAQSRPFSPEVPRSGFEAEPEPEPEPAPGTERSCIAIVCTKNVGDQTTYVFTRRWWIGVLVGWELFDVSGTMEKFKTIAIGFLMLGYVALLSYALAPLGCEDLYGNTYMTTRASIECNWCKEGNPDLPMGYGWLYILAWLFSVIYGIGIPALLFCIMYSHSDEIQHHEYTQRYGFLSTKMRQEWYWWEVAILGRKMALIGITVLSGGHTVRHTLMNLLAVLFAAFLQFRLAPFAQADANLAEGLTLVSTVLVLVIGLGQQAVVGPSASVSAQSPIQTQIDMEDDDDGQNRDKEVIDQFLMCCYVVMALCIGAAVAVILRRLGGVWFMYKRTFNERKRLSDEVMDMLDKSKMDTARAWAGTEATDDELKCIDALFRQIKSFNQGNNRDGLKIKLEITSGAFITYFPEVDRPALYAWMASAPRAGEVHELEGFIQQLFELGQAQQFALWPDCCKNLFIRWVGTQAPKIPMDRRGSLMNPFLSAREQVFTLQEVGNGTDGEMAEGEMTEDEEPWSPARRDRSSGLVQADQRKQEICEEGLQILRERRRRCWQYITTGYFPQDRICNGRCARGPNRKNPGCHIRVLYLVVLFVCFMLLAALAFVINYHSAGCCPETSTPDSLHPEARDWNEDGFGDGNGHVLKCSPSNQQRGSTCRARCRLGYMPMRDSVQTFECGQSVHPKWLASDPKRPPRCVKDGCYVPDGVPAKCHHSADCRSLDGLDQPLDQPSGHSYPFDYTTTNFTCECNRGHSFGKHCEFCELGFTGDSCEEEVCTPPKGEPSYCLNGGECTYTATCAASHGVRATSDAAHGGACCGIHCGTCSSDGNVSCASRIGGADKCCPEVILSTNITCGAISPATGMPAAAPCVEADAVSRIGNGTREQVTCTCADDYTGKRCENGPPPRPPPPPPPPGDHTYPESCWAIKQNATLSHSQTGMYPISPGDTPSVIATCEMSFIGGGWTAIFISESGDNLHYTIDSALLRQGSSGRKVLMGFVDEAGNLNQSASWATFTMPIDWVTAAPMEYLQKSTQVSALVGGNGQAATGPYTFNLIYGFAGFSEHAQEVSEGNWLPKTDYMGQIGLDVDLAEQVQERWTLSHAEMMYFDIADNRPAYPCGGTLHGLLDTTAKQYAGYHRTIEAIPGQTIKLDITSTQYTSTSYRSPYVYVYEGACSGCTFAARSCTNTIIGHYTWSSTTSSTYAFPVSTGNQICVQFTGDYSSATAGASHTSGFTASIACQGPSPSPWFNNFAVGSPGRTPAIQADQRQIHCNDNSSGIKWNEQQCDIRKRFAIFTRPVDCSDAPDCTALHRSSCRSKTNTCGICVSGFEGVPEDSNELCTPGVAAWVPPSVQTPVPPAADCAALQKLHKQTGAYQLGSSSKTFDTLCNMDVEGGGWTAVFVGGQGVDNLHYIVQPEDLAATTALDALVGYVDSSGRFLPGYARFLLPPRWLRRPPMTYVQQHQALQVQIGGTSNLATLVYGYSDFSGKCDHAVMPSSGKYSGSICFMGVDGAPWWNGFATGEWAGTLSSSSGSSNCNIRSGSSTYNQLACSAERAFAIFVRPVDCSSVKSKAGQVVDCGSNLHREACFDKANTCGNCTTGYTGIPGHSNDACVADCSAIDGIDGPTCSSLHRLGCSADGQPNTCGACLPGYSGVQGFSNTLCNLDALKGKTPTSCYDIHRSSNKQAHTGQYTITPVDGATAVVYCEMTTDDGGWTSIFVSDSSKCDGKQPRGRPAPPLYNMPNQYLDTCYRDNQRYAAEALSLRNGRLADGTDPDREVLIGFIDQSGSIIEPESRASFLMPQQWKDAAPMSFLRQHNNVLATIGESKHAVNSTLVYGYADFFTEACSFDGMKSPNTYDKKHMNRVNGNNASNLYKGQICLTGTQKGLWWNNFSVGAAWGRSVINVQMGPGHCVAANDNRWDKTNCSSSRRFAIFVRPIDCTQSGDCAAVHRHNCFSTPNRCGGCAEGYTVSTDDSNSACLADCSAMPADVCAGLHRNPCVSKANTQPNTCGSCLQGFVSTDVANGNALCRPTGLYGYVPRSCYEILQQLQSRRSPAPTGQYEIAPTSSDSKNVVYCEMNSALQGGGWTSIFVSDSARCSEKHPRRRPDSPLWTESHDYYTTCARDNLRYSPDEPAIRVDPVGSLATDREVLIAFVGVTGAVIEGENWASFLIPKQWVDAAPMTYLREHINVTATVNSQPPAVHTLVFGSSYFLKDCDYRYINETGPHGFQADVPEGLGGNPPGYHGYRGQVCLMTSNSPWWSNFSTGDMAKAPLSEPEPGYCKSGLQGGAPRRGFPGSTSVPHCSATRRFGIFVREVDCSKKSAELCASLQRQPCFSTRNTCGKCLPGFSADTPNGAPADRGSWDGNTTCRQSIQTSKVQDWPVHKLSVAEECTSVDACRVQELEQELTRLKLELQTLRAKQH